MAERITHEVTPPKLGPDAQEELERLLQTLHEHGMLRFANDLVAANTQVAKVLVDGLNKPGSLNVVQNLSVLAMALSTIPPGQFYSLAFSLRDALKAVTETRRESAAQEAPGVTGAFRLLQDEDLWRALTPLLEGLKAFAAGLDQPVDRPISAFTGKPSDA
ncbi:hypothetical protein NS383_09300 [Pseudomonas oryzihabitans]|nr:hypothetical protein NS383_09300 [Pseudomonas psychrotolerans]